MGCANSTVVASESYGRQSFANGQKRKSLVSLKVSEAVLQSQQTKKHVFFAYAGEDEADALTAEALKNYFIQRKLRVYCPKEDADINTNIANGIENAAVVLVFPSPTLQKSKVASKLLNYADQTKTPILNIKIHENFQPKDWLGTILAPTKWCSSDFDEVMKSLISMGIKINDLVLERDEKNESRPMENYLFYGGTKSGSLTACYYQYGEKFPMEFEFFGLGHGKVFGQGDDVVGAFTLAGNYKVENGEGDIDIRKQYVGMHYVIYRGNMSIKGLKCVIEGEWEIDTIHDKFSIYLTLLRPYTAETEKLPLVNVSRRYGSKVIISYCPCQYDLAQKIAEQLTAKRIPAVCPPLRLQEMIKIATEDARVVVPLMSSAYEASSTAKYFLSYVDEAGIPLVPIKTQDAYSQSGWLGVICAGALWTRIRNENDLKKNLDNFIGQLNPYISDPVDKEQKIDALVDGTQAQGYYMYQKKKFDMKFDMFTMSNGYIAGQGNDEIGDFVISGKYTSLSGKEDFEFHFKKHYIGKHDVQYSGTTTHDEFQFFFDGTWFVGGSSDQFHLEVSRKRASASQNWHVMLSYQWNNQVLVKRVADMLKQRNIPIWFDIAGDMKGNINTAMANGIEVAAIVISFVTAAYSKSINCQKEFTYASQLNKNIIPILLENQETFQNTWLGAMIAPLNEINMQDPNQFNASFNTLLQQINSTLKMKKQDTFYRKEVPTRFEGGAVEGKYYQYNQGFDMFFDFFSLREGRVSGQGNDTIGPFTMAGNYDNEGSISFIKQYVGQHVVEYNGTLHCDDLGGFEIQGNWNIDYLTDNFYLKSISNIKCSTENI